MRVLVVYGSKSGGTAELAGMVADAFTGRGWSAEVRPAADRAPIGDVDAVVIGGALYMHRWHRDARKFVKRHAARLRELPVWLFSSGPLDDSARSGDIGPVPQVGGLAAEIGANGHVTFGGRLASDAKGFIASRMAKHTAGDWRDPERVREWVDQICVDLPGAVVVPADASPTIDARDVIPAQHEPEPVRRN